MDDEKDKLKISQVYDEGCSGLRHYSLALRNIRIITITQGFAILTAACYLTKENQPNLAIGASVFGIMITGVMYQLYKLYHSHAASLSDYVAEIETKYLEYHQGPWQKIRENRDLKWMGIFQKFTISGGIYAVFVLSMGGVIAINIYQTNT